MKKILVLTDFSSNAYCALFYVVRLMRDTPCTFHLLNAYNETITPRKKEIGKSLIRQIEDESKEGLNEQLHRINLDCNDSKHNFETISIEGQFAQALRSTLNEHVFDLVVMGNKGQSEIEAIFMGSNALDAVGIVKACTLMTIPKELEFKPPKNIAFVTDYKRPYDAGLLDPILFTAKQYRSIVRIVHINEEEVLSEEQERNRSVLLKYLLPFQNSVHWMPKFRSKATAIHAFLEEMQIDLLAMVNYRHSFLESIAREPVIKRMAFNLDIPFLIIPSSD